VAIFKVAQIPDPEGGVFASYAYNFALYRLSGSREWQKKAVMERQTAVLTGRG
jgi:hypothetical protein